MSKSDTDTHLRFGQGILIQGYKQKDNDLGFLTAKGFADIKTKYETYDDILYFKNYRNAIFQILPAGNFQINDQLHKAEIENEGNQETPNIAILKARAKSQEAQFNLAIDSKKNTVITFGTSVIFKHIDSESYISGTIRPSSGSNGAFTVEVSNNLSESLIFKLLPYRSFEFLGMEIPFDSPIILKNEFNNGYLTFEKLGINDGKGEKGMYIQKKPIDSGDSYKIPVKTQSQASSIYECVTHFVDLSIQKQVPVPMPWKFVLQFKQVQNDSLIQHDIVYLQHTQNQGVLSMDKGDIVLKEMKQPPESPGLKFYECLWEIEKHDSSEDAYILRHLMSGQTLGIEYDMKRDENGQEVRDEIGQTVVDENCPLRPILVDISQGTKGQPFGVVQLKLAKKQGGQINSDSHINVAWGSFILQTDDSQSEQKIGTQQQLNQEIIERRRMAHLLKQQIQYKTRKLIFTQNNAQQHCFVIQEIDDNLKKDVLFALSFHSVIINLRQDLKWGAIQAAKKIDYFRMMKVTQKIFEIKQFLKCCSHEQAQLQHIFPIEKRQMICKDLGISQLLFQLLFYMKMNIRQQIFSDKHNERDKFMELYNTIYEVIRQLVRKNRLFKIHISKWIMFVFQDVINSNEASHLRMLKELLEENDFFVTNFVSEKLLQYLTENMLQRVHDLPMFEEKKYLQIFRLFCITGTRVNTANQITIYKTFLNSIHQQKGSVLQFQLKLTSDSQILIKASIDKNTTKQLPFSQFYAQCKADNESTWDYFVEYLNLIAEMTQGRNKVTQKQLAKEFTLQLLTCVFQSQQLYQAEVPILRILHYLYAQSQDFYPVERQKKIVNYNILEREVQPSIISTSSHVKPWHPPFDRVLKKLLQKISECGPINPSPDHFKHNNTVYQLLNFISQTLNLGFWRQKDQVKNILQSVKKILQKHDPLMSDYQQVKKKSAQNSLMIKCKLECLKIIELIADYDRDLFVQRLSINFKDFEIPQKKRGINSEQMGSLLSLKGNDQVSISFMNTIPQQVQMQPLIQTNIVDQMIQLANYDNPQLTSMALSIIQRVLQTKKKAIQHFSSQRFVCSDDILRLVQYIDSVRNQFFILQDPNLTKINFQSQYDNYFLVYQQNNSQNMMTTLYNLSELMKNQNDISNMDKMKTLQSSGCYDYLAADKLLNFTMERSSTSQVKQYIVFCANLHPKVLAYIFNCKELPEEQLALKLLHLCYKFIVALIQNFNQIKVMMVKEIPKMLQHIQKNVGCVDFLKQMYDNNKNMLYNQSQVFELIKFMCDTIQGQSNTSYYKSKLLDFFRYLIYCNGRSLKFIQIQILKIMQDDTYKNIMLSSEDLERLPQLVQQYQAANWKKKPGEHIEISPQLTYMITFFQISASLIDDNNTVNMGKIVKKFPFDKLIRFVSESRTCWPLKRNIRTLLNRLYYFQPEIQTNLKKILQADFPNIISDLNSYIRIKYLQDVRERQGMTFESPVRFSYLQSYLYLNLQQNFFTIFQLVTRQACTKDLSMALNSNEQHAHNFIRIAERLAWVKTFLSDNKNVYTNSMLKFIIMKIKVILEQLGTEIFRTGDEDKKGDIIRNLLLAEGIGKFFKQNSKKIDQLQPLIFQIPPHKCDIKQQKVTDRQRLKQKLRLILKRQKRDFYTQDQRVTYFMNKLVNSLKLSKSVTQFFFIEFKSKVTNYTAKDHIYSYLTTIIEMNSNNPQALPTHLKVFFLQLITFIVEESNHPAEEQKDQEEKGEVSNEEPKPEKNADQPPIDQQEKPLINQDAPAEQKPVQGQPVPAASQQNQGRIPIDQWDPQFWQSNQQQIVTTQNRLKKCNLSKFIVDLLKQNITQDIKFANSILLCAISYLLGGNNLTQKSMLQQLSQDQQNKVFRNIQALIQKLGKLILKNITQNTREQQSPQNNFCPTTIDNYDYFDVNQRYCLRKNVFQPNSTDEHLYHKLCIATYRRVFKFLQLLCENNNIEGKHFIREQPGKQRQINFINVTTRELRSLFQVMCGEIINVPIFLLDFILEVTQIPIKENQQALMRSTFFEDLCQMEAHFQKEGKLDQRNIKQDDIELLQEIYFKSVEIILSNFQGNDQKTFLSLDKKLSSKFLTNILSRKLATKNITNRQQLIKHIQDYCNQEQQGTCNKNTTFSYQIMQCLNVMIIFAKMKGALEDRSDIIKTYQRFKKDKRQQFEKDFENGFLQKFGNPDSEEFQKQLQEGKNKYRCMYEYLQGRILKIEITDNNNQQQTVYFPRYPVFSSLSPNLRDYVMSKVQRSTHRDKIVSLLGFVNGIKQKIEYSYNLQKKQKITQKNMTDSYTLAATFSVIICMYMMFFYDIIVEYEMAQFTSSSYVGLIKFAISLVQLGFSFMYAYYWYKLKIWYKPECQSRGEEKKPVQEEAEKVEAEPGVWDKVKEKIGNVWGKVWGSIKSSVILLLSKLNIKLSLPQPTSPTKIQPQSEQKFYKTGQFFRIFIFIACSVIGTFFYPITFFIHLIDIFCKIQVLANIFQAVAVNIKSLMFVSFMGVVFVFVFCTVTFSNYMKNVYAQGEGIDEMCDDVLDCVMSLYVSGAIGQTMEEFQIGRFTYDMIYGTFFGMLFGNIVQGIMLDAFGSLREKNQQLSNDKTNYCYICNMPRQMMQKKGQTFSQHTSKKHFLWNYVFYIIALQRKSSNDYTGLQYQISQKYNLPDEQMDVSWIPSKGQSEFSIADQANKLIETVKENTTGLEQNLKTLDERIAQFNAIAEEYVA